MLCRVAVKGSQRVKRKKARGAANNMEGRSMYYNPDAEIERRCIKGVEVRLEEAEGKPKITGYAAVFNTWADIGGWFRESIRPGAFAKTIRENDVRALMNHDANYVLGRNVAGTLRLREDAKGLYTEIDPVPTTWANDLITSMKRGDVNQMSFGFQVNKEEANYDNDERVLVDVTLFDVSVVTFPAYPTTTAQVRSAFESKKIKEELFEPDHWKEFERVTAKVKAGELLTAEERGFMDFFFLRLSPPAANHAETASPPPAKHAETDTRRKKDRTNDLLTRAEEAAPSQP